MPRRRVQNIMLVAAAIVAGVCAVLYGVGLIWLDVHQREFIYFPGHAHVPPDAMNLNEFQAVDIRTADGEHIVGWWKPPQAPDRGVVLYLHGNGSDLTDRAPRLRDLGLDGFGVLAIDYRGYGGSTGHPSEKGLNADALAAYDWAHAHAPQSKIALFGESLGSGVAITLATRRPVAGVVLDSAYASMLRLAESNFSFIPASLIMKDTYRSEDRVVQIHAPLFMVHCDADALIPLSEGRRLFAAARQPKELLILRGCGHVETWGGAGQTKIIADLHQWLDPPGFKFVRPVDTAALRALKPYRSGVFPHGVWMSDKDRASMPVR